jgi:hypothetical protein
VHRVRHAWGIGMTILSNGVLNVKAFLESIDESEDTVFKISGNGNYYHITYKQLMHGVLKDRTEVTLSELVSLTSSKDKIDSILEGHRYYSKTNCR